MVCNGGVNFATFAETALAAVGAGNCVVEDVFGASGVVTEAGAAGIDGAGVVGCQIGSTIRAASSDFLGAPTVSSVFISLFPPSVGILATLSCSGKRIDLPNHLLISFRSSTLNVPAAAFKLIRLLM